MTLAQMSIATRADSTWLNNSRRLLRRRLHRTPSGARWWGMVRILNHELGIPLKLAAKAADAVLTAGVSPNRIRVAASLDGSLALQLDLERFHSTANAALASGLAFGQARGRGRPARILKRRQVVDEYSSAWQIRVSHENDNLGRLAQKLREWEAYPRGIKPGLSFIMDIATLRAVPRLALVTNRGEIDVIVETSSGARSGTFSGTETAARS